MNKIFKSFLIITLFSLISRLIGFIFRVYLSRTIGAEALGLYQVSFSVFMVLNTIVCSGIPVIISRSVVGLNTNRKQEFKLLTTSLIITLILALIVISFVLLFKNLFSFVFTDEICILILIILLPMLITNSVYNIYRSYYYGNKKFLLICVYDLIEEISRIIICMLILGFTISLKGDAIAPAISLTISTILSMILVVITYFHQGGKLSKIKQEDVKSLIKQSSPITLSRFATSLIMPIISVITPKLLITAGYLPSEAISLYGIAFAMTMPFLFLPNVIISPLSTVMFPEISENNINNNKTLLKQNCENLIYFTTVISAVILPIFLGCGFEIATFFYKEPLSGILLNYSAVLILFIANCSTTSTILNAVKMEKSAFVSNLIGGVLMLLSILLFTKYLKIYVLIFATTACFLPTTIINYALVYKKGYVSKESTIKICKISFISFIVSILCRLFLNIIKIKISTFYSTIICLVCSYTLLMLLLKWFNLFKFSEIFNKMNLSKIKARFLKQKEIKK